ncbi:MAG: glycosyltransferase involved in cell wall biosynthesis [Halocynthiibacter sp.]|jgi:glycosyltransferase involved in cell wall biosynthesis
MRMIYLTWGEVPRMSSVYGGQVVRVISALQQQPEIESAKLLAGYPVIHSGLFREKHRYGAQLKAIRSAIGGDNFIRRHLPVPPVGIYPNQRQLPFFFVGQVARIARILRRERPDVVHCRSYLAARMALLVRARYGFTYKVIFDARSLLPEEAALTGWWDYGSDTFKAWKAIEKELLDTADLSLTVSLPMQRWFDDLGAKRTGLIYLNVDTGAVDAAALRDTKRLDAGAPVLAYAGHLAEGSWHEPINIWKVFSSFRSFEPGARLTVITKSSHAKLKAHAAASGFADLLDAITFTSAASPVETVRKLQDADLAIFGYRDPVTAQERALAEPVFATKTAEYLCAGLPVIVNNVCGGARDYVLQKNLGVAYDPETLLTHDNVDTLLRLSRDRAAISQVSRSDFSVTENARRLVGLYGSF